MKKFICVILAALMLLSIVFAFGASAETYKLGDITMDGRINASDARLILRAAAQIDKIGEKEILIADVNSDSRVTAADARTVLRIASRVVPELGEITIGETTTIPTEPAELTELADAIGSDIEDYIENLDNMKKADEDSYSNGYVTVTANPDMIADGVISSISVTGGSYAVNGIYVGMDSDSAVSLLKSENWTVKTESSLSVVLTKFGMSMKISVSGGKVSMAEYFIGASLSDDNTTTTTKPDETTTKVPETTTKEPETTTKAPEPTTTGNAAYDALPEQVKAYMGGEYFLEGYRYEGANKEAVRMSMSLDNIKVGMELDGILTDVLITDVQGKSTIYVLFNDTMRYLELSNEILTLMGLKQEDLAVDYNIIDPNSVEITTSTKKEGSQTYTSYLLSSDTESCEIYCIGDEIKRIYNYDSAGLLKNRIDVDSFDANLPASAFTLNGYSKMTVLDFINMGK